MRVLTHGPLQKLNLAATPVQFFEEHHLVDVVARQAIRGGDEDEVQRA
jgi:hypothetical protein